MEKVKCWEVFKCEEQRCSAYLSENLMCWLFSGTHCRHEIQGKFLEKMEICLGCEVFKINMDVSAMRETIAVVNKQFNEYREIVIERDEELEVAGMQLAIGLSEILEALQKISSGDPNFRISEVSDVELISRVKRMVNQTAKNIGDIVEQSHEFAIDIAEHFDVLHRVSSGDLNARVMSSSKVELLESLKRVTNQMITDISKEINERIQAEKALEVLSHRNEMILNSAGEGIFGLDLEKRFTFVNPAAAEMLGYEIDEIIGKDSHSICNSKPNESDSYEDCGIYEAFTGIAVRKRDDQVFWRNNGTSFPVSYTSTPIREKDMIVGAVVTFRDITERKQAEKALKKAYDEMEMRVKERTAELSKMNEQLQKAKEAAETANRSKSQFLANMSHEIRTPLNGVLGMTDLISGTILTDKQRRFVDTIRLSGETLLKTINDILDFSKIEAGKMELENSDFDLYQTVEEVVEILADKAHSKGLEFVYSIQHNVPTNLRGDPYRLRQILTNLVGNAIKFTEEGEVVVRVYNINETKDTVLLRYEVSDTGIGIEPIAKEQVFSAFSQADGSTTRKFGGSGLGLAIAKQLTDMMGGQIGIESEVGKGSTFWFTTRLTKQPHSVKTQLKPCYELQGLRALIVDDNATNRDILFHQLSAWGILNDSAENGPQALEMLRKTTFKGEPYNLAILDMNMPGMDGLELAREIQKDPTINSTRLLMLTSIGRYTDYKEEQDAGILACLTKPVRQSQLYNCIIKIMGGPIEVPSSKFVKHSCDVKKEFQCSVLLAEDNFVNQEVTRGMLEVLGCQVDIVENGLEAIKALSKKSYDLVFMDCQMPEMDGFEATRAIREQESSENFRHENSSSKPCHCIILALTAHAMEGDREQCLASGMDDYLSKPFTIDQLRAMIERWLPKRPTSLEVSREQPASSSTSSAELVSVKVSRPSTIDQKALDNIRSLQKEGDPPVLDKIVNIYLSNSPKLIQTLREAVTEPDATAMQKAAHSLKSSSANMGAMTLSSLCKELEMMGRNNSTENAGKILSEIESEYERVRVALTEELKMSTQC